MVTNGSGAQATELLSTDEELAAAALGKSHTTEESLTEVRKGLITLLPPAAARNPTVPSKVSWRQG